MARTVTNGKRLSTLHIFYNSVMQNQLKKIQINPSTLAIFPTRLPSFAHSLELYEMSKSSSFSHAIAPYINFKPTESIWKELI